ncbi:hypothetical protein PoHVEF18_010255 [Penicillium ochrochloron]
MQIFTRLSHRILSPTHNHISHGPLILKRFIGIPPAFLLDDYIPRYNLLSPIEASKKRSLAYAHLRECNLCPRKCGDIAHQRNGFDLTPEELAEWYIKLQQEGNVHNINLVTPEHVVPQVVLSILAARDMGLRIPIIYNTSSYDSLDSLKLLDGLVDIYLPDFKVWKASTSKRLLKADDYTPTAMESIKEMHRQVGDLSFTSDGIAKKGVLLRHLVMPGKEDEGREIMRWLAENVSRDLYVHIMEQYHPDAHVGKKRRVRMGEGEGEGGKTGQEVRYAEINRAVRDEELGSVRDAAVQAGLWRFCEVNEQNSAFHL